MFLHISCPTFMLFARFAFFFYQAHLCIQFQNGSIFAPPMQLAHTSLCSEGHPLDNSTLNNNTVRKSVSTEIIGAFSKFGAADMDVKKLLSNYCMSYILFLVFEILSQTNCCFFKALCFEGVSSLAPQKPHREHQTVLPLV